MNVEIIIFSLNSSFFIFIHIYIYIFILDKKCNNSSINISIIHSLFEQTLLGINQILILTDSDSGYVLNEITRNAFIFKKYSKSCDYIFSLYININKIYNFNLRNSLRKSEWTQIAFVHSDTIWQLFLDGFDN